MPAVTDENPSPDHDGAGKALGVGGAPESTSSALQPERLEDHAVGSPFTYFLWADSGEPRQSRLSGSSLQGRGALRRIDDAVGGTAAGSTSITLVPGAARARPSVPSRLPRDRSRDGDDRRSGRRSSRPETGRSHFARSLACVRGCPRDQSPGPVRRLAPAAAFRRSLLLTSCRYDGLIKESAGLDDVFWLDLDVGDPCVHRGCSLGWVRRWACLLGRRSLHRIVHDADSLLRGGGRPAHAATAGRSTPITLSRRVSALKANSFTSELE